MGRSESKQAAADARATAQHNQGNADAALANTNELSGVYRANLDKFLANSPYKKGGEFERNTRELGSDVSNATQNSVNQQAEDFAKRTGTNSASVGASLDEAGRQRRRDLTQFLTAADQDRINKENQVEEFGIGASTLPLDVQQRIYGTATGAVQGAQGNQVQAAKTPGFWDTFAPALAQAAGTAAAGAA